MKLLFDIGANRGDATVAGIEKGYKVIALEPAPRVFAELIRNFIYEPKVIPLRLAAGEEVGKRLEFYECVEDGLSTLEKSWLADPGMPYYGKEFRTISVNTCTVDWLVEKYGQPDLIKIDVEGAEWQVLRGMSKYSGKIALEWTQETLDQHEDQLKYLKSIGYTKFQMQFIEHHLQEPDGDWLPITKKLDLKSLRESLATEWENGGWKKSNLRSTSDVGMIWVK
jgi:FkbM family methyltransferase